MKELAIYTSLNSAWSRGTDCLTCTSPDSKKPNNFEPPTHPAGKLQEMFRSGNPYPGGHRRGGDLHYTGSMTFSEYSTLNIQFKKFQALLVSTTELGWQQQPVPAARLFQWSPSSKAERSLSDLHAYYLVYSTKFERTREKSTRQDGQNRRQKAD